MTIRVVVQIDVVGDTKVLLLIVEVVGAVAAALATIYTIALQLT